MLESYQAQHTVQWWRQSLSVVQRCLIQSVAVGADRLWLHRQTVYFVWWEQWMLDSYLIQHTVRYWRQRLSVGRHCLIVDRGLTAGCYGVTKNHNVYNWTYFGLEQYRRRLFMPVPQLTLQSPQGVHVAQWPFTGFSFPTYWHRPFLHCCACKKEMRSCFHHRLCPYCCLSDRSLTRRSPSTCQGDSYLAARTLNRNVVILLS